MKDVLGKYAIDVIVKYHECLIDSVGVDVDS